MTMTREPTNENLLVPAIVYGVLEKKADEFGVPIKRLVPALIAMLDGGEFTATDIADRLDLITKDTPIFKVPVSKTTHGQMESLARVFKTSTKRLLTALVLLLDDMQPETIKKHLLGLPK